MLMPSVDVRDVDSNKFQSSFILCGGVKLLFHILTSTDCLPNADNNLKRYMKYILTENLYILQGSILQLPESIKASSSSSSLFIHNNSFSGN